MKKVFLSLCSLALLVACEKESATKPTPQATAVHQNMAAEKIRVRIGHGIGCKNWMGICIIIPIGSSSSVAPNDGDTYGTAYSEMMENKLHIVFDQQTATAEGRVPISEDLVINDWMGYKQVKVKAGDYPIDYSKNKFGEIWASVETL